MPESPDHLFQRKSFKLFKQRSLCLKQLVFNCQAEMKASIINYGYRKLDLFIQLYFERGLSVTLTPREGLDELTPRTLSIPQVSNINIAQRTGTLTDIFFTYTKALVLLQCLPVSPSLANEATDPAQSEERSRKNSGRPSLTPTVSPTIKPNCTNCTHQATFFTSQQKAAGTATRGRKAVLLQDRKKKKNLLFSSDVLFCIFSDPLSQSLNRPLVPAQTSLASKVEDTRKSGAVGEDLPGFFYFPTPIWDKGPLQQGFTNRITVWSGCGSNDADVYPPSAISWHKRWITRRRGLPVRLPNGFDWVSHMILRPEIDVYPPKGHTHGLESCSLELFILSSPYVPILLQRPGL
ncbi:uncharacterized protein CEXT_527491 [Caerostris extrusa]|uniref:Maturase K n=1 Tax=Caerostris extrusa TaxID=172846 RepID=A0AAV4RUE3_CAEEX|nr:uncharacterized protein CEXT_527491 [Caerostris extrusa]